MFTALSRTVSDRSAGSRRLVFWFLAALAAPGCSHEAKIDFTTVSEWESHARGDPDGSQ